MRLSLLVPWSALLLLACIRAPVEGGDPAIVGADYPDVAVADVPLSSRSCRTCRTF